MRPTYRWRNSSRSRVSHRKPVTRDTTGQRSPRLYLSRYAQARKSGPPVPALVPAPRCRVSSGIRHCGRDGRRAHRQWAWWTPGSAGSGASAGGDIDRGSDCARRGRQNIVAVVLRVTARRVGDRIGDDLAGSMPPSFRRQTRCRVDGFGGCFRRLLRVDGCRHDRRQSGDGRADGVVTGKPVARQPRIGSVSGRDHCVPMPNADVWSMNVVHPRAARAREAGGGPVSTGTPIERWRLRAR